MYEDFQGKEETDGIQSLDFQSRVTRALVKTENSHLREKHHSMADLLFGSFGFDQTVLIHHKQSS